MVTYDEARNYATRSQGIELVLREYSDFSRVECGRPFGLLI